MNWILIIRLGALGAVIGTMAAELVSCVWQYIKMNKYISCLSTIFKSMIYVVYGIVMFLSVRMVSRWFNGGIVGLFFEILIGIVTYFAMCIVYWKTTKSEIASLIKLKR